MKKIINTILFILVVNKANCQTYVSEFTAIDYITLKSDRKLDSIEDNEAKDMLKLLTEGDVFIESKMKIYSNKYYALLRINITKSNYPFIKVDSSENEKYFFDYTKNIVYDLQKNTYSYYIPDTIKNKTNNMTSTLISKGDTAIIIFDESIPTCIKANVMLYNNLYGIKQIETKKQKIKFVSFYSASFDFEKYLEPIKKSCKKKGENFNALFSK